jgi:hypothetical protein
MNALEFCALVAESHDLRTQAPMRTLMITTLLSLLAPATGAF